MKYKRDHCDDRLNPPSAINVLKHGAGASYRDLLNNKSTLIVVTCTADTADKSKDVPTPLVDVTAPHFFDGLSETILEASHFLENR